MPGWGNTVIGDMLSELRHLDERIAQYDVHIRAIAAQSTPAQQLMQLMGIGATTATAIEAMVGNAREFDSGRQFAGWLGLVPGQYSSGGKSRLGRITKAGDAYLRGPGRCSMRPLPRPTASALRAGFTTNRKNECLVRGRACRAEPVRCSDYPETPP